MMKFLAGLLVALTLFASPAFAAVAVDATGSATEGATNTSFDYTGITVGSGAKRALFVILSFGGTNSGLALTWDNGGTNQALALIQSAALSGGGTTQIWGLVAPTSGNKTLHASWTTSRQFVVEAISFTGVNQTGGTTSFANAVGATGTSVTSSVTVTSAAGSMVVAAHSNAAGSSDTWISVNNTQIFIDNNAGTTVAAGNRANGAASVTLTGTLNFSDGWASVGASVVSDAAASSSFIFIPAIIP